MGCSSSKATSRAEIEYTEEEENYVSEEKREVREQMSMEKFGMSMGPQRCRKTH